MKQLFWSQSQGRLRSVWRVGTLLLVAGVIANLVVLALDRAGGEFIEDSFTNAAAAFGLVLALLILGPRIEKRTLGQFGLMFSGRWFAEFFYGAIMAFGAISVAYAALYAKGWVTIDARWVTAYAGVGIGAAIAGQAARYVFGSLLEELMSRGYFLRTLAEAIGARITPGAGVIIAWIVTSAFFGVLHFANPNATLLGAANLSLLGLIFGLPMIFTGRLGCSVGLHFAWNVAQNVIFGMPNSGKESLAAVFSSTATGPALWTGGDFGLEGGLAGAGAIALILVFLCVWLFAMRRGARLQVDLGVAPGRQMQGGIDAAQ